MKNIPIYLSLLFLFTLVPLTIFSQDIKDNKFEFSMSGGALIPGNVDASFHSDFNPDSTVQIQNKVSPLIKFVVDYNIKSYISCGLNINYSKFNIRDILYKENSIKNGNEVNLGTWDGREHIIPLDDIKMLELNASIKGRFLLSDQMVLKPALYLGVRKTFSSSPDAEETGVVLNYNVEYLYYIQNLFLLVDLGFFSQPYGGVEHVGYVRSSGVPYFSLGVGYAL